jgi:hypothetical protein
MGSTITIIQASQHNMAIMSAPIRVNEDLRPSRLVKSIPSYIRRSIWYDDPHLCYLSAFSIFRDD